MSDLKSLTSRQRTAAVIAVALIVIVLMILLTEAAVRVRAVIKYGYAGGIEDTFTYDPEMDLRVPVANGRFGSIEINSMGFRSPELEQPKPAGKIRFAFLGGSTTYCAEVSRADLTWPHLLTAKLAERFAQTDIDYVNGGVPGYGASNSLRNLKYRIEPLEPDVIVIYHSTNDLSYNAFQLAVAQGVAQKRVEEELFWLSKYSLLVYLIEKNLRMIVQQNRANEATGKLQFEIDELRAPFTTALTELVEASKRSADLVILVTFSHHLRRDQTPEQKLRAAQTSLYYTPFMTIDGLLDANEAYNETIREVAHQTGALLVDIASQIPGDPEHFVDSVHMTDVGNRTMADAVFSVLVESPEVTRLMQGAAIADRSTTAP